MKILNLKRFAFTEMGVFGYITVDGATLYTVEKPWMNNVPNISCIPGGEYECSPRPYYKGGYDAVEIKNVPQRSHILFHIGNTSDDVRGCVAVGSDLGCIKGRWAVTNSRKAFRHFMEHYGGKTFLLKITVSDIP